MRRDQRGLKIVFSSPEKEDSDVFQIPFTYMKSAVVEASRAGYQIELVARALERHDPLLQAEIIRYFLLKTDVSGFIIHPADLEPLLPILQEIVDLGKPLVVLNMLSTPVLEQVSGISFIGFDNYTAGRVAGFAIVDYLGGPGVLGAGEWLGDTHRYAQIDVTWYESIYRHLSPALVSGNVVLIEGIPGRFTSRERIRGVLSVLEKFPLVSILSIVPGYWTKEGAAQATSALFEKIDPTEIDVIWTACNEMAFGVVEVLENKGMITNSERPDAPGIAIMTHDGTPRSLEMIKEGKIATEVWHGFPEWGWYGVEFIVRMFVGQPVPREYDTVPRLVYRGNVAEFYPVPKLRKVSWPV